MGRSLTSRPSMAWWESHLHGVPRRQRGHPTLYQGRRHSIRQGEYPHQFGAPGVLRDAPHHWGLYRRRAAPRVVHGPDSSGPLRHCRRYCLMACSIWRLTSRPMSLALSWCSTGGLRRSNVAGCTGTSSLRVRQLCADFLLLAAPAPCDMRPFVVQFAQMCQHSTGLHGEGWQGDVLGVAWRDDHEAWQVQHSVAPIWTETRHRPAPPSNPPPARCMLRARRLRITKATLPTVSTYHVCAVCLCVQWLPQGVRLPRRVPGAIGAENLVVGARPSSPGACHRGRPWRRSTRCWRATGRGIQACNMGLSMATPYVFYNGNPRGQTYYQLHQAYQDALHMVCSEPFGVG